MRSVHIVGIYRKQSALISSVPEYVLSASSRFTLKYDQNDQSCRWCIADAQNGDEYCLLQSQEQLKCDRDVNLDLSTYANTATELKEVTFRLPFSKSKLNQNQI